MTIEINSKRELAIRALGITPPPPGYVVIESCIQDPHWRENISAWAGDDTGIFVFDTEEAGYLAEHYINLTHYYRPYDLDYQMSCIPASEYLGAEPFVPAPEGFRTRITEYYAEHPEEVQYVAELA